MQTEDRFQRARFALMVTMLGLLIVGLTGLNAYQIRSAAQERAAVTTNNLITLVERQVYDTLRTVDLALQGAALEIDRQLSGDGDQAEARIAEFLTRQRELLPEVMGVRAIDAHGNLRFEEGRAAGEFVNVADRDYFQFLKNNADAKVVVFGPLQSRVSQRWAIGIARALRDDSGQFRGAVAATLSVDEFQEHLNLLSLGNFGAATLRMADMSLVARATPSGKGTGIDYGSRITSTQLKNAISENPERGSYTAATALDGIERINAYMKVANYPMYVIVGIGLQDVEPEWRKQAFFVLILGFIAMLLTALGAGWLARIRRRQFDDRFDEARRKADEALRQTNELLTLSEQAAGSGAWILTIENERLKWSAQIFKLFGLDPATDEATLDTWRKRVHPEDLARAEQAIADSLHNHKPFNTSYRVIRPNGEVIWIDAYGTPTYDADGNPVRLAGICVDATSRHAAQQQLIDSEQKYRQISGELERLNAELEVKVATRTADLEAAMRTLEQISRRDALTGLPNRLTADERLRSEFLNMKRSGVPYTVMMLDLDHFKNVNDTFGHAVGDRVLQSLGHAMRSSLRENDLVCRYGGEEFLVILPATTLEAAIAVGEKIRLAIGSVHDPVAGITTISIGVAMARPGDANEEVAVKAADMRLYEAKRAGRDRVVAF